MGVNWQTGIDIYTPLYRKEITSKDQLYNTGELLSILCNDPYRKESKKVDIGITDSLCSKQKLTHCKSTVL